MKSILHFAAAIKIRPLFFAGVVICSATASIAADSIRYAARPGSKVTIAGTSTIHDWTMEGRIIGGFMELPAGIVFDDSKETLTGGTAATIAARVETSIPVRSLKSAHEGMDEVMQQAMNEKDHPKIQYHLTEMKLRSPHAAATAFVFDTKGELVVNGITNVILWPVSITRMESDKLKLTGTIPLTMTDYKVKPPAPDLGLGFIKTGDDITISIEWLVVQSTLAGGQ